MIDYFALALGHGLMAIALLRLVLREDVDADPLIGRFKADAAENRMAASSAGRNAARRAKAGGTGAQTDDGNDSSGTQAAKRSRAPRAQAADAKHSRRLNR
jgi:hypothetical protein